MRYALDNSMSRGTPSLIAWLSVVALLDYEGDEIYFLEDHGLAGTTYAEAQLAFEDVAVIGVVEDGQASLNPSGDLLIGAHTLIVVAEDDGGAGRGTMTT